MKKIVSLIISFIIVFTVIFAASATVWEDDASVNGLDIVVVLDQSTSMRSVDEKRGNDIKGYRIDAVTMLTGMLDMEKSRIALVPFAGEVDESNVRDFSPIKDPATRKGFIDFVENNFRTSNLKPNTNIGSALLKAIDLLNKRADKSNQGMIVLLTDGDNQMDAGNRTAYYYVEDNEIKKTNGNIDITKAKTTVDAAVKLAVTNKYPVYPIALGSEANAKTVIGTDDNTFETIAYKTGGEYQHVEASSVASLPGFFANALANRIGSSQEIRVQPVLATDDPEGKTYELKFPVLNHSVSETNIAIQTCLLGNNSVKAVARIHHEDGKTDAPYIIEMYDNNNRRMVEGEDYLRFDSKYFTLFKIIGEPKSTGIWKLRFQMDTGDPNQFTLNILYNYRLRLNAELTSPVTGKIYKSDTVDVKAYFVGQNELPSSDSDLYADHTDDEEYRLYDWATIRTTWELKDSAGNVKGNGFLEGNQDKKAFEGQIDLNACGISAGEYRLIIHGVGAGLDRTIEETLTVNNYQPEFKEVSTYSGTVNPIEQADQWPETEILRINKADFTDRDGDTLNYKITEGEGADKVQYKETAEAFIFSTKLSGETAADGRTLLYDGIAHYTVICDDGDTNGKKEVPVEITLESGVKKALDTYEVEMTVSGNGDGISEQDTYWKNGKLSVNLKLKEKNGAGYATTDYLAYFVPNVKLTDADGNDKPISMGISGNSYSGELDPAATVPGCATVSYSLGIFSDGSKSVTLNNHEPKADEVKDFGSRDVNVPGNEDSWNVTPNDPVLCKTTDLVTDTDADELTFTLVPKDGNEQPVVFELSGDDISYRYIKSGVTAEGEENKEMLRYGAVEYELKYSDPYMEEPKSILLKMQVNSGVASVLDDYEPEITLSGASSPDGQEDHYKKNADVTVILQLKKNDGSYAPKEELEKYPTKITVSNGRSNVINNQDMVIEENRLIYTVKAEDIGNSKADYTVTCNMFVFGEKEKEFSVPNAFAPETVSTEGDYKRILYCNAVPDWLSSLAGATETPADDPARKLDVPAFFTDQDGDELVYSEPVLYKGEQVRTEEVLFDAEIIGLNNGGNDQYVLTETGEGTGILSYSYSGRIVMKATDGDGQEVTYTVPFQVISIKDRLLTYILLIVAAIIALLIAGFIIHRITMPFFGRGLVLHIRENDSLYDTADYEIPHVKDGRSITKCGLPLEVQQNTEIPGKVLEQIKIIPSRNKSAVKAVNKAKGNIDVTVGGKNVGRRAVEFGKGNELVVSNRSNGKSFTLALEGKEEDAQMDGEFGSEYGFSNSYSGDWGDSTDSSSSKKSKKTRGRKNKSTPVDSGSDNGFDM